MISFCSKSLVNYLYYRNKKKQVDDSEDVEEQYEKENSIPEKNVKIKNLLPIKSGNKIIPQQAVETVEEEEEQEEPTADEAEPEEDDEAASSDAEEFTLVESEFDISKPISATQLLASRNDILRQKKIHIGTLSSGLLENPEEKITNLRTLLKILDEETPEVYLTVRKLVIVSLVEVFKDILPSYEIKNISTDGAKCK